MVNPIRFLKQTKYKCVKKHCKIIKQNKTQNLVE